MEKLLSAKDICERYGCKKDTAYKYMRQMAHMENPLRVTATALQIWESERMREPGAGAAAPKASETTVRRARVELPKGDGKHLIPRTRPKAI